MFFFLVGGFWWQESTLEWKREIGFPLNKPFFFSLWRPCFLVLCRSTGSSTVEAPVMLPWWWCGGDVEIGEAFFNKRQVLPQAYHLCQPPPARGRSWEFDGGLRSSGGLDEESKAASSTWRLWSWEAHLRGGGTALVLFFSAGRGGEGEGGDSGAATMLLKCLIPDGAGGSDLLNDRLPEFCFHPLGFAAPGLECLRYYHMRCVSLWIHPILMSTMVEYQFCSHKAKQISEQQRSWSCLCACESIRRGKDHQRHARTRCLLGFKEMVVLHLQSGCCIWISCQAAVRTVFAFFVPLGCIRRRQMRESPMSLPRFSGEEFFDLSSVMHPQDLQLNPKPHRRPPTRLLVEPLALRLVGLQEAPGEDNCRFLVRILIEPPDRLHLCSPASTVLSVAFFLQCVHLGTWFISVFQSLSCLVYVVSVCYF